MKSVDRIGQSNQTLKMKDRALFNPLSTCCCIQFLISDFNQTTRFDPIGICLGNEPSFILLQMVDLHIPVISMTSVARKKRSLMSIFLINQKRNNASIASTPFKISSPRHINTVVQCLEGNCRTPSNSFVSWHQWQPKTTAGILPVLG